MPPSINVLQLTSSSGNAQETSLFRRRAGKGSSLRHGVPSAKVGVPRASVDVSNNVRAHACVTALPLPQDVARVQRPRRALDTPRKPVHDEKTIVIKNVHYDTTEADMEKELAAVGAPPVSIEYAYNTAGSFRGTAFVQYASVALAERAVFAAKGVCARGRRWEAQRYDKDHVTPSTIHLPSTPIATDGKLIPVGRGQSAPALLADALKIAESVLATMKTNVGIGSPAARTDAATRQPSFSSLSSSLQSHGSSPSVYIPVRQPRGPDGTRWKGIVRTVPVNAF